MTSSGGRNNTEQQVATAVQRTTASPADAQLTDAQRRPKLSRRDLLRGRIGKLLNGPSARSTSGVASPRLVRIPNPLQDLHTIAPATPGHPAKPIRSINGIAIDAVPATSFRSEPLAPQVPLFRPPGAVEESMFLERCTKCGDCQTACPYHAIRPANDRLSAANGTPTIEADHQACLMCADFPCITACQTGALQTTAPKVIGTAMIKSDLCLAGQGQPCRECVDQCPEPGAITTQGDVPIVIADACTGCGVCRTACVAPDNAVVLMPVFQRQTQLPQR